MALGDVFGGLKDLLRQTSEFTKDVMGSVNDIKNVFNPQQPNTVIPTTGNQPSTVSPTYDLNLKLSDFGFTPNWYLLAGGAALLLVALVLAKK